MPEDSKVQPPKVEEKKAEAVKAEAGATVALANDRKPVTVDGVINIGMDFSIHMPSEAQQRAGFIPKQKGEGEDKGKMVDATLPLLRQFPGIYKPVTSK